MIDWARLFANWLGWVCLLGMACPGLPRLLTDKVDATKVGDTQFRKLFEPGLIGSMDLKNRLVMPPMATNFGSREGLVTRRMLDYYEERARGGVGLVIVEFTCVDSFVGRATPQQLLIDDDKFIPGLGELAQAIKRHGAMAVIQLHHAGRQSKSSVTGHQPVAPSPIPAREGELPRELTLAEIAAIVERFGEGAYSWVLYPDPDGEIIARSAPFYMPANKGQTRHVKMALGPLEVTASESRASDLPPTGGGQHPGLWKFLTVGLVVLLAVQLLPLRDRWFR